MVDFARLVQAHRAVEATCRGCLVGDLGRSHGSSMVGASFWSEPLPCFEPWWWTVCTPPHPTRRRSVCVNARARTREAEEKLKQVKDAITPYGSILHTRGQLVLPDEATSEQGWAEPLAAPRAVSPAAWYLMRDPGSCF